MNVFHDGYVGKYRTKSITYRIEGDCWICTSHAKDKDGYPQIYRNGRHWKLTRWVYNVVNGDLQEDLVILHSCDNPSCMNPTHLSQGSSLDNVTDKYEKGRDNNVRGENIGTSVLSNRDVWEIKHLLKYTKMYQKEIGYLYGVTQTTIGCIKRGELWSHISIT